MSAILPDDRSLSISRAVQTFATIAASCPPLLQAPIEPDQAEELAAALKVLADPARLRLLSLIQAQPDGKACVCNLTEPLGLSQPTVSHHLKVLLQAGLVERDQRGSGRTSASCRSRSPRSAPFSARGTEPAAFGRTKDGR